MIYTLYEVDNYQSKNVAALLSKVVYTTCCRDKYCESKERLIKKTNFVQKK